MDHLLRGYLERRSTEELDCILDYTVHNYAYDPANTVQMILEILKEREKNMMAEIPPQMRAQWESILQQTEQNL